MSFRRKIAFWLRCAFPGINLTIVWYIHGSCPGPELLEYWFIVNWVGVCQRQVPRTCTSNYNPHTYTRTGTSNHLSLPMLVPNKSSIGPRGTNSIEIWIKIQTSSFKKIHLNMRTSSNGIIFRVTGPLRGEFTGHRWIPLTKASDAELWNLCLNKWLSKQSRCWWFETLSCSLWRHRNECRLQKRRTFCSGVNEFIA